MYVCTTYIVIVIAKFILKYKIHIKQSGKSMQTQTSHKSLLVPNIYVTIYYTFFKTGSGRTAYAIKKGVPCFT